jgi:predicted MFS family arabinose efflux permease
VFHFGPSVSGMSTSTQAGFSGDTGGTPAGRLISGPLALVFLSSFGILTSFYLLLSVTPMYAAAAGASSAAAGLVTAALLLGTVAAELAAASLMKRFGYRPLLAAGAALLGIPALALLSSGPLIIIVAVGVVRGIGFGLSTVITGALTATLLPPGRRGEGLGLSGVVACVPAVVALPSGVWLAGRCGYPVVLAITAATALVPLAACPWLPGRAHRGELGAGTGARQPAGQPTRQPAGLLAGLRQDGQLRLSLLFVASTMAAGVVVSFLPLATGVSADTATGGLLAQAVTATISRWWAGRHGDRRGHAGLLIPGLAISSLGMTAMIWLASPAAVIAGMCLFGTGFGISQNAIFALMIDRMPASGFGAASAIWNLAYDAGYGAGPAVFGLFADRAGYPAAFALTGVLMLAALPAARRERAAALGRNSCLPLSC